MSQFFSSLDRTRHKSTVQTTTELTNNGYIGKELANSEQINVLSAMQDGTKLLKLCARRTRSHWRKFQLDPSNTKIRWVSDKKDVNDTTIFIANIIEIICHSVNIVKKFKDTLPEELTSNYESLQQQQFTIRYMEHNKNLTNYLPQLSPNTSLHNQSLSNIIKPNHTNNNLHHSTTTSSSFIRTLKNNNNIFSNKMTLVQPEYYIDESVTDSSSNNSIRPLNSKKNKNNKKSFWKNLLKHRNNNNNNTKKHKQQQHKDEIVYNNTINSHERNSTNTTHTNTDSSNHSNVKVYHNNNNTNTNKINYSNYHVQELHLMAQKPKIATIWIYGLERLIELNTHGIDLSLLPKSQFKISTKELMNYSISKGYNYNNKRNQNTPQVNEELTQFKLHLDEINDGLYNIIEQMPSQQRDILLLEQHESKNDNYLIRKIRQDQNDLDYILHQVSKARFDKKNLKRWSYILTRIEINIGGYQIAINNQKYVSTYHTYNGTGTGTYNGTYNHERKRSKSSSMYSLNNVSSPFTLHQQQYSNSKYNQNRNTILKNRSPRSPNNNTITISSDSSQNVNILPSPKYDSV